MEKLQKHFRMGGRLLAVIALILFTSMAQAQLADSPWPMFRHDERHTGQSTYVGPSEANLAWILEVESSISEPVIGPMGTIYIASGNKLYAVNPGGFPNWIFQCENTAESIDKTPAIAIDSTIYFATKRYIYAITNNGVLKWNYKYESKECSSPVIDSDGIIYVDRDLDTSNTILALDKLGNIIGDFKIDGSGGIGPPAIGLDSSIYVISGAKLYSGNLQGELNWVFKWPTEDWSYIHNGPCIASDGTIYITAANEYVVAVNPDGTQKWSLKLQDEIKYCWPAIGADGTIYVSTWVLFSKIPKFYAINPDGTKKWEIEDIYVGKPTIGSNGIMYDGGWWNYTKLYAVTPNGNWNVFYEGIASLGSAIDKDGTLYVSVAGTTKKLYAFYRITPRENPDLSITTSNISFVYPFKKTNIGTEVNIKATIKELNGKQGAKCTVSFYLDDKLHLINTDEVFVPAGGIGKAEVKWNTTGINVGKHKIIAVAGNANPGEIDIMNNEADTSITLWSDWNPPIISFASPQKDSLLPVKGFDIKLVFSDIDSGYNNSGIDTSSLQITCDKDLGGIYSSFVVPAGTNLTQYFKVYLDSAIITVPDSLAFPIGSNMLTATIRDSVGNISQTASLKIKNDIFAVTFPHSGIYVNYTPIPVTGFAVYPSVSKVLIDSLAETPEIDSLVVTPKNDDFKGNVYLTEGPNTLVIVAYDTLDNIVEVVNRVVIYDTTKIIITITNPPSDYIPDDSPITIEGIVNKTTVKNVTISLIVEETLEDLSIRQEKMYEISAEVIDRKFSKYLLIYGRKMIIRINAIDAAGNVGSNEVLVNGETINPNHGEYTRLFLRHHDSYGRFLSEFAVGIGHTTFDIKELRGNSGSYERGFILPGDIIDNDGDNKIPYTFNLMLASVSSTNYSCDIVLAHKDEGNRELLASASFYASSRNWKGFSKTVFGPDPVVSPGDTLILKVSYDGWAHFYTSYYDMENRTQYYANILTGPYITGSVGTEVEQVTDNTSIPRTFNLEQNYPNPFNPETTIKYQLPKGSEVTIKIYNITGQLVVTLVEQQQPSGYYSINWNGKDETGQDVASGLYFYQIRAKGSKENFIQVRKMLLVR